MLSRKKILTYILRKWAVSCGNEERKTVQKQGAGTSSTRLEMWNKYQSKINAARNLYRFKLTFPPINSFSGVVSYPARPDKGNAISRAKQQKQQQKNNVVLASLGVAGSGPDAYLPHTQTQESSSCTHTHTSFVCVSVWVLRAVARKSKFSNFPGLAKAARHRKGPRTRTQTAHEHTRANGPSLSWCACVCVHAACRHSLEGVGEWMGVGKSIFTRPPCDRFLQGGFCGKPGRFIPQKMAESENMMKLMSR